MNLLRLSLALSLLSLPALAARSLDEPDEIARKVRRVPAKRARAALEAAGLSERCTRAALKDPGVAGLRCRLTVLGEVGRPADRPTARSLRDRLTAAALADEAAHALATYQPIRRARGFEEERATAHARACGVILGAWDEVRALPTEGLDDELAETRTEALSSFGREEKGIAHAACACVARSVELVPPDAEGGARGALQSEMTSRACFLDKGAVSADRGGPEARFSGRAAAVAEAAASDEAAFRSYAESRAFELKRCTDKHARLGRVSKPDKLAKCACRSVKRWRFPAGEGRAELRFDLPLVGQKLETHISAAGEVTRCGPLRE